LIGPSHFVSIADLWAFVSSGLANTEKLKIGYEHIDIKTIGPCIHEDGGKNAIFEALPTQLVYSLLPNMYRIMILCVV